MVLKRSRFQYRRQRYKGAMFEVKIKQLSAAKEDTDKKVIENETKTKMTARQPHGETTNVNRHQADPLQARRAGAPNNNKDVIL